ncbi:tellurite resistance/C4-dicarboxylate transporter family protein [Natrinema sp. DC36]|uniref:tellurite resistance/C4-dicarboxylate transporter family protein n=1 Tax=Natrinema sp. DC36 TaxID=2878680 RepID=UPI001CF03596|nr:tellurite resistance/C4-dicarboxylate transporter family protein [Natrinema sp. DC36]
MRNNDHFGNDASESASSATSSPATTLRELDPAYFGLVMSTGIISIAFHELGIETISWPFAVFNLVCYILLIGLFAFKVALFPGRIVAELRDRERHWGALTFIVGTNTVGVQLILFFEAIGIATILWLTTVVATPLLLYYLFTTEFIGTRKSAVSERIDGAFLLVIVCMQSLAVLGGLLSTELPSYAADIVLLSMGYFGAGYVLYFVIVTVVTYRLLEGSVRPADWTGPYWITMGAAAITTLAGSTLGPRLESVAAWEPYVPVILGVTFLAWAIASWWIPLLLVIDIWKFLTGDIEDSPPVWVVLVPWSRLAFGQRLHVYDPAAWGRVFPMGMYTACTLNLAGIQTFSALRIVPEFWGWFALVVWALTLLGAIRASGRALLRTTFGAIETTGSP